MKLVALLVFLLPLAVAAQTKTDYETAMAKFQNFYNKGQGDSIDAMFGHRPDNVAYSRRLWTDETNAERLKEYGRLKSFRFIGIDETDPNRVYVFKTIFSKAGTKTTSLTLYKDNSLGTFRFLTTSESIDELLRKAASTR